MSTHKTIRLFLVMVILALHGVAEKSAASAPQCHVISSRHFAKATSEGHWAGITCKLTYRKGLCNADGVDGQLDVVVNGQTKSLKAREGNVTLDNIAMVRFSLTTDERKRFFFFSELCWSLTNCTTLCNSVLLGSAATCTTYNNILPLLVGLLGAVPIVSCGAFLLIRYARHRRLQQNDLQSQTHYVFEEKHLAEMQQQQQQQHYHRHKPQSASAATDVVLESVVEK